MGEMDRGVVSPGLIGIAMIISKRLFSRWLRYTREREKSRQPGLDISGHASAEAQPQPHDELDNHMQCNRG